jgi:uncharacterized protein HemX
MAANRQAGATLVPLLLLLVLVAAAGAWNYHRNWTRDKAEEKPRLYKSFSDTDLAQMEEGYRLELAKFNEHYGSQRSRRVVVQNRGLIGDQIDEFERVQRAARRSRQLTGSAAELQAQLDQIAEEHRVRSQRSSALMGHLKRLVRI